MSNPTKKRRSRASRRIRRELRGRPEVIRLLVVSRLLRVLDRAGLQRYAEKHGRVWPLEDGVDAVDPSPLSGPIQPAPPRDADLVVSAPMPWTNEPDFVCELRDVSLIGTKPIAVTSDGGFVLDSIAPGRAGNVRLEKTLRSTAVKHGFARMRSGFRDDERIDWRELGLVCVLTSGLQRSYYHWVLEQLTKLRAVDEFRRRTGETPALIVPRGRNPWMRELIALVGYGDARLIKWQGGDARAERVVLPSFPMPTPANCRWLRERVVGPDEEAPTERSERILIARGEGRRWWRRMIVNQDEVEEALRPLGFRCHKLGEMSVAEQAELFSRAEVIVGSHGAGFTNMVFSTGAKVVELFGRDVRPHFFRLAHTLGLPYRYLLCKPVPVEGMPRREDGSRVAVADSLFGLHVDVEELKRVLAEIGVR